MANLLLRGERHDKQYQMRANAADVARAGANVLVAGSAVFKAKSYAEEIRAIRTAATSIAV